MTLAFVARGALTSHAEPAHTFKTEENLMDNDDNIGGYAVPVDPQDLLQCDSCQ